MDRELEVALEAARQAGGIQLEGMGREIEKKYKGPSDIVTEIDLACEKAVIETIGAAFPDDSFLAEEGGETRPGSDRQWIVDPLDGTTNYAHRFPRFCVSIALAVEGKVMVGVVRDAAGGETFRAVRGGGAFLNDKPIRASETPTVEESLICTGFSYDKGKTLEHDLAIYLKVLPRAQSMRRTGSAALDLCDVAAGRLDAFWEHNLNAWDIAAGSLIIEEAGGRWSGLRGEQVGLDKREFLCTNGRIHNELVGIMAGPAPVIVKGGLT